jgi:hypothetical protein
VAAVEADRARPSRRTTTVAVRWPLVLPMPQWPYPQGEAKPTRYFPLPHLALAIVILTHRRLCSTRRSGTASCRRCGRPCASVHPLSVPSLCSKSPRRGDQSRRSCAYSPLRHGCPTDSSFFRPLTESDAASSMILMAQGTSPTTQAQVPAS